MRGGGSPQTPSSPLDTHEGDVVGTPTYMAPEQAHGWIDQLGPATDVYAIGAILYELLTAHRPYMSPDESDDPTRVLRSVRAGPPPAIRWPLTPARTCCCQVNFARPLKPTVPVGMTWSRV